MGPWQVQQQQISLACKNIVSFETLYAVFRLTSKD